MKTLFTTLILIGILASPCIADYRSTIYARSVVYSPESLGKWMVENLTYQKDTNGHWKTPEETLKDRGGDCEDLATLAGKVLERLGYKGYIIIAFYRDSKGKRKGHAIYTFREKDGTWSVISNLEYIATRSENMLIPTMTYAKNWKAIYIYNTDRKALFRFKRKVYTIK